MKLDIEQLVYTASTSQCTLFNFTSKYLEHIEYMHSCDINLNPEQQLVDQIIIVKYFLT